MDLSTPDFNHTLSVPTTVRTLFAAGFVITDTFRGPRHIELSCEREDILGVTVPYLIALVEADEPSVEEVAAVTTSAKNSARVAVLIANRGGEGWLGWEEFLEALGGAVPTWRALDDMYIPTLRVLAKNELPEGLSGEAWRLFEMAVADGLEFVLGRRVLPLGGGRRGQRVTDMVAQTPDERVLVVDAKASKGPYDAATPKMRPLGEYVSLQRKRQRGQVAVSAALIIADRFVQNAGQLGEVSKVFLSEHGAPASFLEIAGLELLVVSLGAEPFLRGAINWALLLCGGGLVTEASIKREVTAAQTQRLARGPSHSPPTPPDASLRKS
jgi:hypothetical protein